MNMERSPFSRRARKINRRSALHDACAPPPTPAHVHVNGPLPATVDAVPTLHNPLVGALATATPFAEPHAPSPTRTFCALHDAVSPPSTPAHVHVNGPSPCTDDATPAAHNPLDGAVSTAAPSAGPHAPSTATTSLSAPHDASAPPPTPAQVHENGPSPATVDGAPTLQSPLVGASPTATPLAGPHTPSPNLMRMHAGRP
jgi:hypothetical protein